MISSSSAFSRETKPHRMCIFLLDVILCLFFCVVFFLLRWGGLLLVGKELASGEHCVHMDPTLQALSWDLCHVNYGASTWRQEENWRCCCKSVSALWSRNLAFDFPLIWILLRNARGWEMALPVLLVMKHVNPFHKVAQMQVLYFHIHSLSL